MDNNTINTNASPLVKLCTHHGPFSKDFFDNILLHIDPISTMNFVSTCRSLHKVGNMRCSSYGLSQHTPNAYNHPSEAAYQAQVETLTKTQLTQWQTEIKKHNQSLIQSLFPDPNTPSSESRLAMENVANREITANKASQWFNIQLDQLPSNPHINPDKFAVSYQQHLNHCATTVLDQWESIHRKSLNELANERFNPVRFENIDRIILHQRNILQLAFNIRFQEIYPNPNLDNPAEVIAQMKSRKEDLERQYTINWANDQI